MTLGAAREHVRVARRLAEMPLVGTAFSRGELSYSKVRALVRAEGVRCEDELLELTRHATATQLERIVRGYRGVLAAEGDRAYRERFLSVTHDDDGPAVRGFGAATATPCCELTAGPAWTSRPRPASRSGRESASTSASPSTPCWAGAGRRSPRPGEADVRLEA